MQDVAAPASQPDAGPADPAHDPLYAPASDAPIHRSIASAAVKPARAQDGMPSRGYRLFERPAWGKVDLDLWRESPFPITHPALTETGADNSQIIDDLTFSLPLRNVRIHFIDGSATTLSISESCARSLGRVVEQVNLSFAPKPTCPPASPSSNMSSSRAVSPTAASPSIPSPRRSTSALLLTLLSPLLPGSNSQLPRTMATDPQQASRMHRRQARSMLVDAYRNFVLPELKSSLPSAYLPWAISSEVTQRTAEYEAVKLEINSILASTGYDMSRRTLYTPESKRARSFTASSNDSSSSSSESEFIDTPMTSAQSSRCSSPYSTTIASPHAFLLSIPPAHELPSAYRATYSHQLADLTRIASRLAAIKKLDMQYEREETKRKWLETLERGKAGERALRRAWSNGQISPSAACMTPTVGAKPVRSSPLWRSWTAEDEERRISLSRSRPIHPAMMDDDEVSDSDNDNQSDAGSDSCSSVEFRLVTPPASVRRDSMTPPSPVPVRPSLISCQPSRVPDEDMAMDIDNLVAPAMMLSKSDDSLPESNDEWDHDHDHDQDQNASIERVTIVDNAHHNGTARGFIIPPMPPSPRIDKGSFLPALTIPGTGTGSSFKGKLAEWARIGQDELAAAF